jgi:ABC-2 type transport system ATP-binding protein
LYAIQTFDLTRYYDGTLAVDHINLHIDDGMLFGFLGPNGAGKTTTIKMLSCILKPTEGSALVAGCDIKEAPLEVKKLIGYSPEYPVLYEKLTAREFLDMMAFLHGIPNGEREQRVKEMLELFDLKADADQRLSGFSKGMKRKVNLASAIIHRPKVVFLDEPTMGLDARSARLVKDIMSEFCRRGGTVFMSTHVMEIAERICERIAIINEGKIVAQGTIEELRSSIDKKTLEEVFLALTGEPETTEISRYL